MNCRAVLFGYLTKSSFRNRDCDIITPILLLIIIARTSEMDQISHMMIGLTVIVI